MVAHATPRWRHLGGDTVKTVVVHAMRITHTTHNQVTPQIIRDKCECLVSERSFVTYSIYSQPNGDQRRWDTRRQRCSLR